MYTPGLNLDPAGPALTVSGALPLSCAYELAEVRFSSTRSQVTPPDDRFEIVQYYHGSTTTDVTVFSVGFTCKPKYFTRPELLSVKETCTVIYTLHYT
jgi:hypothetical protein